MKQHYTSPNVVVERYEMTQNSSSCSALKVNFVSANCVLEDGDSTLGMIDLALNGGFLNTDYCLIAVGDPDPINPGGDGFCYHTSSAMAFTS